MANEFTREISVSAMQREAQKIGQSFFKRKLPLSANLSDCDLIVFSHLRWEFVYQRPQHIVSRLARGRKVLFVEEPIEFAKGEEGTANVIKAGKNITVLQPKINTDHLGDGLEKVVKQYSEKLELNHPMLWFYSANFVNVIPRVGDYSLIVYDCMDELSAFLGAPFELRLQEQILLSAADVVFTGGKSLFDAKKDVSKNVHCFPSSVDRKHFEKSAENKTSVPIDIMFIPKPRLGFYGVLDERLDINLIAQAAKLLPHMSFVMIGPVIKIPESSLPKLPNIHYLGPKGYNELPHYLKDFDVALVPFALNESTKFISPTKTLEYMAGGKPIISTPINDVVRDYKNTVAIVNNAQEFAAEALAAVHESAAQKVQRLQKYKEILDKTSWDNTAKQMKQILGEALRKKINSVSTST